MARFNHNYQAYEDIFLSYDNQDRPIREEERRFIDGFCLYDTAGHGAHFLSKIRASFKKSQAVEPLEKNNRLLWHQKMLARAENDDIEGKYRRIWLIYALLEDYFVLRDLPYEGPKKSFKYLHQNDRKVFDVFDAAMSSATQGDLEKLVTYIRPS